MKAIISIRVVWQLPETQYEYRLINQITELNSYEIGALHGRQANAVATLRNSVLNEAESVIETGANASTPIGHKAFIDDSAFDI